MQTPKTETGDSAAISSSSSSMTSLPSVVEILDEPFIPVIPFGIALPTNKYPNPDYESNIISSLIGENGIVGSITIMGKKSAMIWVGFGMLDLSAAAMTSAATTNATTAETTTTTTKTSTKTSSNSETKNKSFSFGKGE
jgi:hypothetical protein